MLRFRAGLLAVCIAFLTALGLVTATGANADTVDPAKFTWQAGTAPVVWGDYEDHDWNYWRQVVFGSDEGINQSLTATAQSPLTSLTGTKITAPPGTVTDAPLLGSLCKSGYGCTIAGVAGAALAAYGLFGPDGGNVDTERQAINEANFKSMTLHPVQQYASARVVRCSEVVPSSLNPANWGANNPTGLGGWWIETKVLSRPDGIWGCGQANMPVAFDCHRNGVWVHTNGQAGGSAGAIGSVARYGVQYPCGPGNTSADWEIRKVHYDQTAPGDGGQNAGTNIGYFWGLSDPLADGSMRATTRCQRPDTTLYSVVGAAIPVAAGKVDIKPCAAGDKPLWVQTDHIGVDGTTVSPQSVQNLAPAAPPDWAPDCKVAGSGCRWVVKVGNVPCTVGQAGCTDWTEHKEDAACFYGPYPMPLESCNLLERAYEPQPIGTTMPATRVNWDGNPTTTTGPARVTTPTVAPTPTATASASPSPDTDPTTRPSPSSTSTTSTAPIPPPGSSGAPNPADTAGARCFPSGWAAFNPVQWVLMPMRCALEPDPVLTRTRVDALRSQLEEVGPGPLIVAVSGVVEQAGDSGGCAGPNMPFHIGGVNQDIHPFSACAEPMATAATYVKALATVVIVIGGGLAMTRAIASGFGFSFSMGKGSTDGD